MAKLFSRSGVFSSAAVIAIIVGGQSNVFAQTSGTMGGTPTNGVSTQQLKHCIRVITTIIAKWHPQCRSGHSGRLHF